MGIVRKVSKLFSKKNVSGKGGWPGLRVLPSVDVLYDVGIGHQGTKGLYSFFPHARKIMIDPVEECRLAVQEELKIKGNIFLNLGLSDTAGSKEIYLRHPISRSGFHSASAKDAGHVEKRNVAIATLEQVMHDLDAKGSVGVKIDTEGHELQVLHGAVNVLEKISFVILELPIGGARFAKSYTFEDAMQFMIRHGFKVVAIRPSGDGTNHCDVAFLNQTTQ